jgi:isocitrate lyase
VKNGLEQGIDRGLSYAPYSDLIWMETGNPDLGMAREFAQGIHAKYPGKMLAYNCSPSFNWAKFMDEKKWKHSVRSWQIWATNSSLLPWQVSMR